MTSLKAVPREPAAGGLGSGAGAADELKRQVGADTVELVTADNLDPAARLEAACVGITCAFAALFLTLAVTGFGRPD